jgi:hypothetical protein
MKASFLCKNISHKFKNIYCARYGKDYKKRNRNLIRRTFTFIAHIFNC